MRCRTHGSLIARLIPGVAASVLLLVALVARAPGSPASLAPSAWAQTSGAVTRGPYLQMATPGSIVVRWRTDAATDSRVVYGPDTGTMSRSVSDPAPTTDHEVTLRGLSPATRYRYAVGTSAAILAGGSGGFPFSTPPRTGTATPTRIWVVGDSGTADSSARSVRDAYAAFSRGARTDLWLMLGDNAYPDGTDGQYQEAVFDMYPDLLRTTPLWPTLGNHDGATADSSSQSGPYFSIFTLPKRGEAGGLASGTEAYYSFDYGNVHFISLDSFDSSRSRAGAMMTWLREDVASTDQTWIIAFWHHPPYSKGSHDSDSESELEDMRRNALPILEQGGVDLVLSGHSHSYERSFLLDGHYGSSSTLTSAMKVDAGDGRIEGSGAYRKASAGPAPHEGAVYVVAGTAGHTSGGSFDHPAMFVSLDTLGSLVLDVNGPRLDAAFLDSRVGVRDHFTLLKGQPGSSKAPAAPGDLAATAVSSSQVRLTWSDRSLDESGFHIERCEGAGCDGFERIASVGVDVTVHADGGALASTTYRYRVSAFNGSGESAYSGAAAATTPKSGQGPSGAGDYDQDGVDDASDVCPTVPDGQQMDSDGDAIGDACEDERLNANVDGGGFSARRIDGSDLFRLLHAFGSRYGEALYNPLVDLDRDLRVDGRDLAILTSVWASEVPRP